MSNKSNRPLDKSDETSRSNLDKGTRQQRITNSSRELNRNEEQTSPSGRPQPNQSSRKDLDRSSDQMKSQERNTQQWNQGSKQGSVERNQTTGSNVPGSEIADRTNSDEHMKKTSRESYTGNSERAGSQYSVTGNSSQIMDKDLKSGHPSRDQQHTREGDMQKRTKSANQGMEQESRDVGRNRPRHHDDSPLLEE